MKALYALLFVLCLGSIPALANNVQLTNVSIINSGPGDIQVQFDVSWDNGWRTNVGPANYDGVWVFFKYKQAGGDWTHLNMTGNDNVIPSGFDVFQNNGTNKTGAMLYREPTNMGMGSVSITGVRLGVISTLPYNIDVRGFALEMVFVPAPTGARPVFGDGNGTTESVNALHYTNNLATNNSVLPMLCDANGFDDAELEADGIYVYSNENHSPSHKTRNPPL